MRTETRVSTQDTNAVVDLDRTDELPALDVEAYEAHLAEKQRSLGRTDTWSAEALHDVEELTQSATTQSTKTPARSTTGTHDDQSEALTVNVQRILERIAAVEDEIVAAQQANGLLQKRCEQIQADRDDLAARLGHAVAAGTELSAQLGVARDGLQAARTELAGRNGAIAEKDRQIGELTTDLDQAGLDLVAARQQHDVMASALSTLDSNRIRSLDEAAQLRTEVDALRESLKTSEQREADVQQELSIALVAAKDARQARTEVEELLKEAQQRVATLTEELDTAQSQLRSLREEREAVDKSRARINSLTQELFGRDSQIAALQADLAVYTEALAAIRRDVSRIGEPTQLPPGEEMERVLEPLGHDGDPIVLNGEMYTVGRTGENDIAIPSRLISRRHARLLVGPTGVIVEDAGSTNGCFVNGQQVRQHLMRDGDVLELGDARYRLSVRSAHATRPRADAATLTG